MTHKSIYMSYLEATHSADSPEMRLQRQREEMRERMFEQQEYQKLVKDVGDYVLAHMELNLDIEKILIEIEKLNKAIEELGK